MSQAKAVANHEKSPKWAEERGARASGAKDTESGRGGDILRFDFAKPGSGPKPCVRDQSVEVGKQNNLARLKHSDTSRPFEIVNR